MIGKTICLTMVTVGMFLTVSSQACEVNITSDLIRKGEEYRGHVVVTNAPGSLQDIEFEIYWNAFILDFQNFHNGRNCSRTEQQSAGGVYRKVTISCNNMSRHDEFPEDSETRYLAELRFKSRRRLPSTVVITRLGGDIEHCGWKNGKVVVE